MEEAGNLKLIGRYSYYTGKCLGQGSFGKVFEGFENTTKQKVAIKQVQVKLLQSDSYLQGSIESEIRILSKFKHPNIVQLHEVLSSKRSLYIVTEYCKHGDLRMYLKKRGFIPQQECYLMLKQVVCGFKELVKEKVIHRDLKPANILVHEGTYKICDFGFAKQIDNLPQALKSCVGSPIYMAPQILQKQKYNYKCDIWSLGIIYYELLHGVVPWKGMSESDLMNNIRTVPLRFSNNINPQVQRFIRGLLTYGEADRLTWDDVFGYFGLLDPPLQVINGHQSSSIENQKQMAQLQRQQGNLLMIQQQKEQDKLIKAQQQQKKTSERQQQNQQLQLNQLQDGMFSNPRSSPNLTRKLSVQPKPKFLTRHNFQQLALRHFVCVDIKTKAYKLRKFNFSKNLFQKILLLFSYSIRTKFEQFRGDVQKIHDPDSLFRIRKDEKSYNEFYQDILEWLQQQNVLNDLKKEPDFKRCIDRQPIGEQAQKYDKLLFQILETAKSQIADFSKEAQNAREKDCLMTIYQNISMALEGNEQFTQRFQIDIPELIRNRVQIGLRPISRASTKVEKAKTNEDIRFFS